MQGTQLININNVMVTVWWVKYSLIDYNFISTGETINAGKYCSQIDAMDHTLAVIIGMLWELCHENC